MRAVVQRVTNADVKIDGRVNGKIDDGLLVLLGVGNGDTEEDMKYIADKIIKLRIFSDENDKMNLSLEDVGGSMLVISQLLCTAIARMADDRILATQWSLSAQMKCMKNLLHISGNKVYILKQANSVRICKFRLQTTDLLQ